MFKGEEEIEQMLREKLSFEHMIAEISRKLKAEASHNNRDTQLSQELMNINIT